MVSNFEDIDSTQCQEPIRQETVDLLRAEITQLEQELADRDAKITELTETLSAGGSTAETEDGAQPDTLALVARLEQLLDELDRKDQREASLQEMLRAAEEANEAEHEERAQIESWLAEIERRVGERESEWQAANESLRQRIDEVTAERDRAERSLTQHAHGATDASTDVIAGLRKQVRDLQEQLREKERVHAEAKERLHILQSAAVATPHGDVRDSAVRDSAVRDSAVRDSAARDSAARDSAARDSAAREERLQIARDRAELARQRAELEHAKIGAGRVPDEVDQRVQALRQHLREIHDREEQERKEKQERSLSGRIARLWKRLEAPA